MMLNVTLHALSDSVDSVPTALGAHDVHIWQVMLDDPSHAVPEMRALLAVDERARCERLRTPQLQRRFIVRRGLLRLLLSRYIGFDAAAIRFAAGQYGKPALASDQNAGHIYFNISDSDAMTLYAFTGVGEIGVDVERVVPIPDLAQVAAHWFSPLEQLQLGELPPPAQTSAFYRCWTRKEAIIKCVGTGLTYPVRSFSVNLTPGKPALLLQADDERLHAFDLTSIPVAQPFIAACAVALPPHLRSSLRSHAGLSQALRD